MVKIRRYTKRTAGNSPAGHRRWLGIERLESRAMLHGDEWGDDFISDFEFDFADSGDFSPCDFYQQQQYSGFFADSYQDSPDLFSGMYADSDFEDSYVWGRSLASIGDDPVLDEQFESEQGGDFGIRGLQDHVYLDRDLDIDLPVVNNLIIEFRPAPVLPPPLAVNQSVQTQISASITPPQRIAEPLRTLNRSAESHEVHESLIHATLSPTILNVPAVDKVVGDFKSKPMAAPNAVLSESKVTDSAKGGISAAVESTENQKFNRSTVSDQTRVPRPLGLDGMLSLGTRDAKPEGAKQSAVEANALGIELGDKPITGSTGELSLREAISSRSAGLRLSPHVRSLSQMAANSFAADSSVGQQVRYGESAHDIAQWPAGMLELEIEPTVEASQGPLVASMDPLAIAQLFIHFGESRLPTIQATTNAADIEATNTESSAWRKWLQDPRVSAMASVALGLIAIATSRRGGHRRDTMQVRQSAQNVQS